MESKGEIFSGLRQSYPEFVFESFSHTENNDVLSATFVFRVGTEVFQPTFKIPVRSFFSKNRHNIGDLQRLIFNIGMIELISYWKATCSPKVIIKASSLPQEQKGYWKKLYFNGLGEFFYTNGIAADMDSFMDIISDKGDLISVVAMSEKTDGVIVPIGGGKDSVVTLELLKKHRSNVIPLIINPRGATLETLKMAGFEEKDAIIIHRTIDKNLLALNAKGFLNGHTPFSAMLATYSVLASYLTGVVDVALSNELSADESTVHNSSVNHQYSKSLGFENDFRAYTRNHVLKEHNYFSFLRPLNELKIASLFSEFTQYYPVFKSCNVGSKQDVWCEECSKCLFAYIILSPFIEEEILAKAIFSKNLLEKKSLETTFMELIGKTPTKPFECVGTVEEVNVALAMLYHKMRGKELPYLLKQWYRMQEGCESTTLRMPRWHLENNRVGNLTEKYFNILKRYTQYPHAIRLHKEWEGKNIMILGWGREGRSTYKFFRTRFPDMPISVSDQNEAVRQEDVFTEDRFLKFLTWETAFGQLETTDRIIKSPGISFLKLPIGQEYLSKVTSQTEIFLNYFSRQCIGITGTKGKTTTTTLLHDLLLQGGVDTVLAGNGGVPVLDVWNSITPFTKIVLELSSHQLEHIRVAPAWSAVLNVYEEHLDYYKSYDDYRWAKMNIAGCQKAGDTFLYSVEDVETRQCLSKIDRGQHLLAVDMNSYHWDQPRFLYGKHNLWNVLFAATIAEKSGVSQQNINQVLAVFRPQPHRLEPVGTFRGVDFFDDSISTIPEATIAALEAVPNITTVILGGFDRGIHYEKLITYLLQSRVENIVFMGKAGERMSALLPETHGFEIWKQDDMKEIVKWCVEHTKAGCGCLLSPAASSYDRYKNFEHRGQAFQEAVKAYET